MQHRKGSRRAHPQHLLPERWLAGRDVQIDLRLDSYHVQGRQRPVALAQGLAVDHDLRPAESKARLAMRVAIGKLAEDLDLSKSGLFAHFHSKEAMLLGVLEVARAQFVDRVVKPG
jgi:hypothetical protein